MAEVFIRGVDTNLKEALKKQAKSNNRSMNNEVIHILQQHVELLPDEEKK